MAKTARSNLRVGNSAPTSQSAAPDLERELYELLFKEAADGIFVSDGSGRYVDVNERGCKMLGYKRGELLRMNIRDLVPPEDLKTNPIRMEDLLAGKLVVNERRLRCKNGKLLPVEVSGRLLSNGHLLGVVRDISARRTAEEVIGMLARFPSENPSPVLRVGFDGKIQYANKASRPLLEEWRTEVGRALPRAWKTRLDACARDGSRLTEDVICGERVFSLSCTSIPEVGYVNVYGRDVTDRRRAEQAWRITGENYRLLFQNHPIPMWVYELKTLAFLEVNEAALEKYGCTRAEFMQMTLKDIRPAEDVARLMADVKQERPALQHSGAWRHRLKDGRVIDVEITSHTLEYNGRAAVLVAAQDITERKQAEARVQYMTRLYATLSQINQTIVRVRERDDLFSSICRVAVEYGGFQLVWIGLLDEKSGKFLPAAFHGHEDGYLKNIRINIHAHSPFGQGPTGMAVREGNVAITQDIQVEPGMQPWRARALKRGYRSSAAVPIRLRGRVVGALNLYAREPGFFSPEEQELLAEIGMDISFALDTLENEKERRQAEESEQLAHRRLQQFVDANIVGVVFAAADGRVIETNDYYLRMIGFTRAEFEQGLVDWRAITPPEWLPADEQAIRELREHGTCTPYEKEYVRRDGNRVPVLLVDTVLAGPQEQIAAFAFDLTEMKQAEASLHLQNAALEASANAIVITDTNGVIQWANPAFADLTGYTLEESIGRNPRELVKSGVQDRKFYEILWNTILNGGFWRGELVNRRKDGSLYDEEMTITPVKDAQGFISHLIAVKQDISERKRAETELHGSEERYRDLFENSPISLWEEDFSAVKQRLDALREKGVTDFRAYFQAHPQEVAECASLVRIVDVNRATLDLYGASSTEDLLGNLTRFLPDESYENFYEELLNMAAGMTEFSWTGVNQTLDGRRIDVNLRWSVAPGYEDSLSRVIISITDITERMEAELALRASEERYRDLVENISDLICTHDLEGQLLSVNRAAVELTGYSLDELIGKNLHDFFSSETRHAFDAYLTAIQKNGNASGLMSILTKSGERRIWEYHNTLRVEGVPNPIVRGYARDITERRQAEQQIRQLNTELEQRVEERTRELRETQERLIRHEKLAVLGKLAGGVGHELRNPLAIINNAAYYLKLVQPDADVKIKEYLGLIERETRNAEKIISDLLDFARVKSADREAVSVSELVQRVLERFPAPESVEVTLDFPPGLPQIFADPRQMEQVLGNLVVNACQAMPSGGKLLVLSRVEGLVISDQLSVNREQWILIRVKDTGVGIPPENMNKLFEPLFTTKPKGIGLGLAVSQKLAEANGGRIEVQSEAGVGSTFTVWLPVQVDKQ